MRLDSYKAKKDSSILPKLAKMTFSYGNHTFEIMNLYILKSLSVFTATLYKMIHNWPNSPSLLHHNQNFITQMHLNI